MLHRLRWRLAIVYLVLTLAVITGLGLALGQWSRQARLATLRTQLFSQAGLLRAALGETGDEDRLAGALETWEAKGLSEFQPDLQVTVFNLDGNLVWFSRPGWAGMPESGLELAEVQEAFRSGSAEHLVSGSGLARQALYVALRVDMDGDPVVLRLGLPLEQAGNAQQEAGLILALFLSALALGSVGLLIAFWAADPLARLAQISGGMVSGNLFLQAQARWPDETGALAQALNTLVERIRLQAGELERLAREQAHTEERLASLQRRAMDYEIASGIARAIADLALFREEDLLLQETADLICSRLEYDWVGIYRGAVLRAEAGMEGAQQEISMPTSSNNQDGPRPQDGFPGSSQVRLPLKGSDEELGVLEVRSNLENAFEPEDVSLLETIAGQLAVALQNARLYGELQTSLGEIRALYQRFTLEKWAAWPGRAKAYDYDGIQVRPATIHSFTTLTPRSGNTEEGKQGQGSTDIRVVENTLQVPLKLHDQAIGVLGFEAPNPGYEWPAEAVALAEAVAGQVALALDNARLLEQAQLRSEQSRLLQEITSAAASHIDLPDLLADVAHRLVTGFELQDCRFVFLDPDGQMGTLVDPGTSADSRQTLSEKSEATKLLETRIHAAGNAVLQDTLRQQKPLVLYGGVPHTALQELFSDEGPGPGPVIVAPLHSLGKTIGALAMAVANAGRHFEEDDLRLIEQISLQISGAIDVARLFEQTQQRAEREHLVAEITTRLRASNDPQQILKTAADELRRALRAKRAQVIVPTHDPSVESVQSGE